MGLRQSAVPLGGALAAIMLPVLAAAGGPQEALIGLAVFCAVAAAACAIGIRSPARSTAGTEGRPLRDRRIWRLALGSALLITSQIAVIGFVVLYVHDERGFSDGGAGAVLAVISVAGMVSRIAAGRWSDRLVLRLGPLRRIAAATAVAWAVIPLLLGAPDWLVVIALVIGGTLASSWNGLSFTATAEFAAGGRAATAIALQQTALFATAAVVPPLFGAIVEAAGWQIAFWTLALGPGLAWWVLAPLARGERATSLSAA
jgi:predicted MFS family arabinose efflux permease